MPPLRLQDYLAQLCESEGVPVEPGVLSFVVRAGGGSVRDSLSVLDQLIAGSGEQGLTYEGAAALLGFTDGELLDATVDGLAAGNSATVFRQIDKVIESGHDPRRFVEDVLERLRDLIVVAAVPDGASSVLRGVPEDQLERMRQQAAAFGPGALSRAADIVNAGLTEMSGATAPRLQLELICARVLLPGASGESGYAARLDRLERRLEVGGAPAAEPQHGGARAAAPNRAPSPAPSPAASPAPAPAREPSRSDAPEQPDDRQRERRQPEGDQAEGRQPRQPPERRQPEGERPNSQRRSASSHRSRQSTDGRSSSRVRASRPTGRRTQEQRPQGGAGGQQPAARAHVPAGGSPEGPGQQPAPAQTAPTRPAAPMRPRRRGRPCRAGSTPTPSAVRGRTCWPRSSRSSG